MKTKQYKTVKAMLSGLLPGDKEFAEEVDAAYDREKIANHLFTLRNKAGVSQKEMAKRLGVTQSAVSKMENKADSLSFNDVVRYGRALGFSTEFAFIKEGRAVDFLHSYFSRITRMMDMLREMAGDDPDINAGILTAFGDFSKSMMDNVLPKFKKVAASRLSALEIAVPSDAVPV